MDSGLGMLIGAFGIDPKQLVLELLKAMSPTDKLNEGDAVIYIVSIRKVGENLHGDFGGGWFTNVDTAKEMTSKALDEIYSGQVPGQQGGDSESWPEYPDTPEGL